MLSGPIAHDHSDIVLEAAARHANGVDKGCHCRLWRPSDRRRHDLRSCGVLEESVRSYEQAAAERYGTERYRVGSAAPNQRLADLPFREVGDGTLNNEPGSRIADTRSSDLSVSYLDHDRGRLAAVARTGEEGVDAREQKRPGVGVPRPEIGYGSVAYGLRGERSAAGSTCAIGDDDQESAVCTLDREPILPAPTTL
jgi:hypothetical protein